MHGDDVGFVVVEADDARLGLAARLAAVAAAAAARLHVHGESEAFAARLERTVACTRVHVGHANQLVEARYGLVIVQVESGAGHRAFFFPFSLGSSLSLNRRSRHDHTHTHTRSYRVCACL